MAGSVERTECQLCLMIASGWCQSRQRRGILQQCSGARGCEQICTMCGEKKNWGWLPSRPLSGLVDLDYLHWQNDLLEKIVEWGFQTMPLPSPLLGSVGGNFWESRISRSMLQKHLRTKETELGNESYQQKGKREKDMEAGERGAAGNHSLGGKRIKVAVGEGGMAIYICISGAQLSSSRVSVKLSCTPGSEEAVPNTLGVFLVMMMSSHAA